MDLEFLTSVLMIVGIDVVLGGDNAIVIALASRNLPESKRNKAILIGTLLAIVLRIILTILAVYLLDIPFLQLIGGVLLTLIAVNLLTDNSNDLSSIQGKTTLFQAVRTIVFADLVMGFDNVIAIAGAGSRKIFTRNNRLAHFYPDYYLGQQTHFNAYGTLSIPHLLRGSNSRLYSRQNGHT